jgi:hypothetical protein
MLAKAGVNVKLGTALTVMVVLIALVQVLTAPVIV